MRDYLAHPMFTNDADDRFAAIAKTVVNSESQFDLVSDFEKLVQDRASYVRDKSTLTNPRCRGSADAPQVGLLGSIPVVTPMP